MLRKQQDEIQNLRLIYEHITKQKVHYFLVINIGNGDENIGNRYTKTKQKTALLSAP